MASGSRKKMIEFMKLVKSESQKYSYIQTRLNQLINEGVDQSTQDYGGNTLLHLAVSLRNEKLLTIFLKMGVRVNLANDNGETPLHKAIIKDDIKAVNLLIKHGADLNATCEMEQTGIHIATIAGNIQMVKCLVESGADYMQLDESNNQPIDLAIDELDEELVKYFLSKQVVDEKRLRMINDLFVFGDED